jgi:hypothetical protein
VPSHRGDRGSPSTSEVPVLTVAVLVVFLGLLTSADLLPALLAADTTGLVAPLG